MWKNKMRSASWDLYMEKSGPCEQDDWVRKKKKRSGRGKKKNGGECGLKLDLATVVRRRLYYLRPGGVSTRVEKRLDKNMDS